DGDERAVVRDAVLEVGLRGGHLVVAVEAQLAVLDREDRVGAPLVLVGLAAAGLRAAAPLVGEEDLRAVVAERGGVPEGEVRVGGGVGADRVRDVADVEQQAVAAAGAAGEADLGIDGDVVALGRAGAAPVGRRAPAAATLRAGCRAAGGHAALARGVGRLGVAGRRAEVGEDAGRADDRGLGGI